MLIDIVAKAIANIEFTTMSHVGVNALLFYSILYSNLRYLIYKIYIFM